MNTEPTHCTDWYLAHVANDAERFAALLESASTDLPVAACPGWDVLRLAQHLGQVQRWAAFCVINGRAPTDDDPPMESFDPDHAAEWLRSGAAALIATLSAADPDGPTWHPFPVERVGAVWPRRLAHETAMHRWDAEHAAGLAPVFDADLASDGIDEYFELAVPRLIARNAIAVPDGSLHVHCTDVDGEWLVWSEAGEYRMVRAHQKGDAALRGPAAAVLLRLWGRDSGRDDELSPIGDEAVLASWLSMSGM